jgi:hypothetical protein
MAKLDQKFTEELVAWLRSDHTDDGSIRKGAMLLLRMNRNQGLYQRICRQPQRGLAKLEYEIRKHLNYRLDGYTIEDVVNLDNEIVPVIKANMVECDRGVQLAAVEGVELKEAEVLPVGNADDDKPAAYSGKRPDHEALPDDIRAIWDKNAERWKRIKETYNLLLTLNAPCDRFEHLKLLKETWYKYREDMCRYDDFKADTTAEGGDQKPEISEEDKKAIDVDQSYISRNLPVLMSLVMESREPDFANAEKLESLRAKIQERVFALLKHGVVLSEDRKADLVKCDISLDIPADNAEGEGSE